MIEGGCQCGAITYAIEDEIADVSHCHCSICRKIHGAAFATYGVIAKENFRWTSGQDGLTAYNSSPDMTRSFCDICSSVLHLIWKSEPHLVYVTLGTVKGDPIYPPAYHIFTGSKASWYRIADDLPQHETWEDA